VNAPLNIADQTQTMPHALRGALRRLPGLRSVTRSSRLWKIIRLLRAARAVRPGLRFLVGEACGGARRYQTAMGQEIFIRHRTRDVDLVNEIMGVTRAYEPPLTLEQDLRGPLRVLDLGANIGIFGAFALGRWPIETMASFEPDPANAALLQKTILANAAHLRWQAYPMAVGARSETIPFVPDRLAESRRAFPGEPNIDVQSIDVFSLDYPVDLLKLDIESSEWEILADPRMATLDARVIVMEWHALRSPTPDPRTAARTLLEAAGYAVVADRATAASEGLMWAKRPT
jgi:FkbM family methyltransferase